MNRRLEISALSVADKTVLEAILGMDYGYVLDFSDASIARFFDDIEVNFFDDKYTEYGRSKAKRLRGFWKLGTDREVAACLVALANYVTAKKLTGKLTDISDEQIAKMCQIARSLEEPIQASAPSLLGVTTEATVTNNRISIEIHPDIYRHIQQYLDTGDHFHAVEESYKVVREKLRELTGAEAAGEVFNQSAQSDKHYAVLFGKDSPTSQTEGDFFRGVGYLHLGIQFLRNEKAHSLATFVEPNLAVHYISLASLAYDMITRKVSQETIAEIEEVVAAKRRSYWTSEAFYKSFDQGRWLDGLKLPAAFKSYAVRNGLRQKWLEDADLTVSFDTSNIVFMRLELIADELTNEDLDYIVGLPTHKYGRDQSAGMGQFLEFINSRFPDKMTHRARERLADFVAMQQVAVQNTTARNQNITVRT